jgi:hypothetical protein
MSDVKLYYHFTGKTLRDGKPVPAIGEWLELPAEISIVACPSEDDLRNGCGGLHASPDAFDALQYAPGSLLHRVELDGDIVSHGSPVDKFAARRRKIVATIDAESLLWEYARKCALSVIHLWDAPEVVNRYLETGDESLRAAARAAAWDAARDAAWDAAWAAARDAARAAARDAAGDAAWVAARAAAWDAARAAARDAAWAAAWDASRYAALDAHRKIFTELVDAAFAKVKP